jgi:hypothetical protein
MEIPSPNINLEGTLPIMIGNVKLNKAPEIESSGHNHVPIPLSKKEDHTPELARAGLRRFKTRQNRPQTTCLVFRPDRPKPGLPTPKPETWRKSTPKTQMKSNAKDKHDDLGDKTFSSDLSRNKNPADLLVLNPGADKSKPPCFAPAFPGLIEDEKPKWQRAFVRKGNGEKHRPGGDSEIIEPGPGPRKPEQRQKSPNAKPRSKPKVEESIPHFPKTGAVSLDTTAYEDEGLLEREKLGPGTAGAGIVLNITSEDKPTNSTIVNRKKATLPYPKEDNILYPLPDFSFNVVIDGERREPIGWNITRNTLSLRRAKGGSGYALPLPSIGWSSDPALEP